MTLLSILTDLFSSSKPAEPSGAEAIVVDYQERQQMVADGHETIGQLYRADRIVNEGIFQSQAVAQLWFDLGEYGDYPMTLDLPDGPNDDSELDAFMARVGMPVHELSSLVDDKTDFAFIRVGGEWQIDWDETFVTEDVQ